MARAKLSYQLPKGDLNPIFAPERKTRTEIPESFGYNYSHAGEQELYKDLYQEAIATRGITSYYFPREYIKKDDVLGEGIGRFKKAIKLSVLLETVDGFDGDRETLSQWGFLEVRDEITVWTSIRDWNDDPNVPDGQRTIAVFSEDGSDRNDIIIPNEPREGDILYIDLFDHAWFEIRYVDSKEPFYNFGVSAGYKLVCEKWAYSGEDINIPEEDIEDESVREAINIFDDNERTKHQTETADDPFSEGAESILDTTEKSRYGNI